jgi:hypothetical protein
VAWNVSESVGLHVVAGKHQENTGHLARCCDIEFSDLCVRDLRAQHKRLRHFLELDIICIVAFSGNKGPVFETPNGLAQAEFHDCS